MSDLRNNEETETVQVKYKKYSIWTIFKLLAVFISITWLGNFFAYSTVGMNHVLSKFIGLAQDVAVYCADCLRAIGG